MKFQPLILLALSATLISVTGCDQEPKAPSDAQTPSETQITVAAPEVPEFESVHDLMEELVDSFKFLLRHTESGEASELLEHSATIRALVAQAKTMTPEQVEDADEADKAQLSEAFQKHLSEVEPALDAYDVAIQADDRAAAAAAVEHLAEAKDQGHEALDVGDD